MQLVTGRIRGAIISTAARPEKRSGQPIRKEYGPESKRGGTWPPPPWSTASEPLCGSPSWAQWTSNEIACATHTAVRWSLFLAGVNSISSAHPWATRSIAMYPLER